MLDYTKMQINIINTVHKNSNSLLILWPCYNVSATKAWVNSLPSSIWSFSQFLLYHKNLSFLPSITESNPIVIPGLVLRRWIAFTHVCVIKAFVIISSKKWVVVDSSVLYPGKSDTAILVNDFGNMGLILEMQFYSILNGNNADNIIVIQYIRW